MPPRLTLFYSVVDDETLPEMIRNAHDSAVMEAGLKKTSYSSADSWQNYEAVSPARGRNLSRRTQDADANCVSDDHRNPKADAENAQQVPFGAHRRRVNVGQMVRISWQG
jgi:hypothetical protein